ncbi:element excision factor XisH family protein [Fischerella thermalis]|nr:element excision factor XisH family protein [Fischerella thermalis]
MTFDLDMPVRDIYHDAVKNALIQEGWLLKFET